MSDAQHQADIGQHMTELEWTVAQTAWNEYDKARAAINHEFQSVPNTMENQLAYSLAILELERDEKPSMPRPGRRPGAARDLRPVPADHTGPRPYWGE